MIDSNILKIDKILARNVSRETLRELEDYSKEIINRNSRINLISKNTEKSIKSIVCALSSICLVFIVFSVLELIKFMSLFFLKIDKLYLLSSSNVSRETF